MKKFFILSAFLGSITAASAQDINGIWHESSPAVVRELGAPAIRSEHFTAYNVSEPALKAYLATAPMNPEGAIRIALPSPDGGYRTFRLWSTPLLAPELGARFPEIRTYTAELEGNRSVTAKIDYTTYGFHAMVFDGANTYLINPYGNKPSGAYMAAYKRDMSRDGANYMTCEVGDELADMPQPQPLAGRTNGTSRKNYRLAVSCTGEYAIAVDGPTPTVAGVLSKIVTTVNRVTGVYQRELAVSFTLVANNDQIVYLDPAADPYSDNSNSGSLLGENQANTNTVIGAANYDIGHIFSTGAGGLAGLGIVCQSSKARGVTGRPSPVGDAYDIDYVAHEIGHQFSANHTFNAGTGSCAGGNRNNGTAFEPGSGSTIMAYAGLCAPNNIQNNSNDYFHSVSLEEISSYITLGAGGACPTVTPSTNTNATMGSFSATYVIPTGTPFELTAPVATDATSDTALNFCWEQRDLGNFGGTLAATTNVGPLFRSFTPQLSRTRVFPAIPRMLVGQFNYNAEKLPTVSRTMIFGLTQRDYFQGWGAFNFPDDRVTLQAELMDPFRVTSPDGGEVWIGGDFQTITWDVSSTNVAPVSCANVDIYMSTDGGLTFPTLLKGGTPNDGQERVQIPNTPSNFIRIKVKSSNNVFFSVSRSDNFLDRGTVGVPAAAAGEQVSLSPVPATSSLRLSIPQSLGTVKLRLLNMLGQTIWTGSASGEQVLDASVWPRGIYQLNIQNEGGFQQTRKLTLE